jgi:hypothetical protein
MDIAVVRPQSTAQRFVDTTVERRNTFATRHELDWSMPQIEWQKSF